jgi:hypothetical protein
MPVVGLSSVVKVNSNINTSSNINTQYKTLANSIIPLFRGSACSNSWTIIQKTMQMNDKQLTGWAILSLPWQKLLCSHVFLSQCNLLYIHLWLTLSKKLNAPGLTLGEGGCLLWCCARALEAGYKGVTEGREGVRYLQMIRR